MQALSFGVVGLMLIALMELYPKPGNLWIMQVNPAKTDREAGLVALSQPVTIVEAISNHTFIVKADPNVEAIDLLGGGVVAVVQAIDGYGCSPPRKSSTWTRSARVNGKSG